MHTQIDLAIQHLHVEGVIAYPTEAVWGLGADPLSERAVQQLLRLKQRPIEKGLIVVGSCYAHFEALLSRLPDAIVHKIMTAWENDLNTHIATTWLVPHHALYPYWVTGAHDSLAIRLSHHPIVQQLCNAFGRTIISTSANPNTLPPATHLHEAQHYFKQQVVYVDGALGENAQPSRIIDALSDRVMRI